MENEINNLVDGTNALKPEINNLVDGTSALKSEINDVAPNNNNNDNIIEFPKLDAGKKIDEKGNISDSATKKTLKAVGRGAGAYFTGGKSLQYDKQITNNRYGDKLLGVVSDGLEKVPGVEEASEALDELNVQDSVNAVMDVAGDAMNGDITGAIKDGFKAKKEINKTKKQVLKKVLIIVLPILFFFLIFMAALAPVLGGFMDTTNGGIGVDDKYSNSSNGGSSTNVKPGPSDNGAFVDPSAVSNMDIEITEAQIEYLKTSIQGWDSLNQFQKNAIMAAYSRIGKTSYLWSGKPSGPGNSGIGGGLDCSGFVSWVIWTASGNTFNQSTDAIASSIRSNSSGLTQIDASSVQAGDIVVLRRPNNSGHALLYAGNNQYIHLAGKGQTVKMSSYSFKSTDNVYYARYQG